MVLFEKLVETLKKQHKTIASMESCTGGAFANAITSIPGASEVLSLSVVTYSNQAKIKMGVPQEVIEEYSVYSIETAKEMSRAIAELAQADYGVGFTGQMRKADTNNPVNEDDAVYISLYDKANKNYMTFRMKVTADTRPENKEAVIQAAATRIQAYLNKQLLFEHHMSLTNGGRK